MTNKISPSMMCCDFFDLRAQINELESASVELLHIDIMDGSFVPNFALGCDYVRQLKKNTNIHLDLHFMTREPEHHLELFPFGEGDYVSVHFETATHLQRALQTIRSRGAKALLAINPSTPIEMAIDVLDDIDGILVMTVNPGFAGQKMIPHSIEKVKRVRTFLDEHGCVDAEIEVDGNVSIPNAINMKQAGANIFVLGTAALFGHGDLCDGVKRFRNEVGL